MNMKYMYFYTLFLSLFIEMHFGVRCTFTLLFFFFIIINAWFTARLRWTIKNISKMEDVLNPAHLCVSVLYSPQLDLFANVPKLSSKFVSISYRRLHRAFWRSSLHLISNVLAFTFCIFATLHCCAFCRNNLMIDETGKKMRS